MKSLYVVCPDGWVFAECGKDQLTALRNVRETLEFFGYGENKVHIYTEAAISKVF